MQTSAPLPKPPHPLLALIFTTTALVFATACTEDAADPLAEAFESTIQEINALTQNNPAFTAQVVDDNHVRAAIPTGWEKDDFRGYSPPGQTDTFNSTTYDIGTTCDGACQPKDWAASFETNHLSSPFLDPSTIVVQESLTNPTGKLVISRADGQTRVIVGRWQDGAPTYFLCRATLRGDDTRLEAAFKLACTNAQILSFSNVSLN